MSREAESASDLKWQYPATILALNGKDLQVEVDGTEYVTRSGKKSWVRSQMADMSGHTLQSHALF